MPTIKARFRRVLQQFGHDSFRPGQEEVVQALLRGLDVVALFPTGAGKSLLYQFTSQLLGGVTLVVSPLIALMQDQVDGLNQRGISVSFINSTLSVDESESELARIEAGEAKLLYVTPERFDNADFIARMRRLRISLLVVDEAHCLSDWGHSFRPAYLALANAVRVLGKPTVLALTATATPWVRQEIIDRLGMREPVVVVRGMDRPNLFFEVRRVENEEDDRRVLRQLLFHEPEHGASEQELQLAETMRGTGIIYVATTEAARQTADWLKGWGIAADYYHGQRRKEDRERVQDAFMDGSVRVIVATNAFGLGINKSNVRFVIHRDVPGSIEAYYQEAGRAGRDGEFSRCVLIYRQGDLGRAAFLSGGGHLTREEVRQAQPGLIANPKANLKTLARVTGLSRADLVRLITTLAQAGIVEEKHGRVRLLKPDFDPNEVSLADEERRRAFERSRLDMMRGYAEARGCRRRYLLNYFGEVYEASRCNHCDNDDFGVSSGRVAVGNETQSRAQMNAQFVIGERVAHTVWGKGVVQSTDDSAVTVLFDTVGYKTLAIDLVVEQGLLAAA